MTTSSTAADITTEQQTNGTTVLSTVWSTDVRVTAPIPPDVVNSAVKITLPEFTTKMASY